MRYFRFIYIIIFFLSNNAFPSIIIDAETQEVIKELSNPIFKVAKLKKPEIFVINNPIPNAFTDGNERIYINSGLIYSFPTPNILRGVIAHEVGHISSNHVARIKNKIDEESKASTANFLLGAAASIATLNPSFLVYSAVTGHHMSERAILKYSRENESIADQKATKYLAETGYSNNGLIRFLEILNSKNSANKEERYDMTHPLNIERIHALRSYKFSKNTMESRSLSQKFLFLCAKLSAFASSRDYLNLPEDQRSYGIAISSMIKSDKINALSNINKLIQKYPLNPYFLEAKAEILTKFGDSSGLKLYHEAYSLNKNIIFKIEESIAKIILLSKKDEIESSIAFLELQLKAFDNNITIINYLSLGFDKIGKKDNAIYYRALAKAKLGQKKEAITIANSCKLLARHNNKLLVKIDDLISSLK